MTPQMVTGIVPGIESILESQYSELADSWVSASVVHAKPDSAVHARNQLSCARGCWCSSDGDDGDGDGDDDDDDGGDDDDDDEEDDEDDENDDDDDGGGGDDDDENDDDGDGP